MSYNNKKSHKTATDYRYMTSLAVAVGKQLGLETNADGSIQTIPESDINIVYVNRIYPDSMSVQVTYKDSTVDNGQPNKTTTAMILSPMCGEDSKLLWMPNGSDYTDAQGVRYRVPIQSDLTGVVTNINGDFKNGVIFLGYIHMPGESNITDTNSIILTNSGILTKTDEGFVFTKNDTSVTIEEDDIELVRGNNYFKINENTIEMKSGEASIVVNGSDGNVYINGAKV